MRWGKVMDQDRCIGCHACSVACKSENDVPLGSFRTWVKQVEKGVFPDVRRHFAVLRCNQCEDAPCVRICPTAAMFRRPDGIVDFDPEICIGCKSCIQACPYDAIYMDPRTSTAAKCNFCAHRVEIGLEPACVTACPENALIVGDLDDPSSRISGIVSRQTVSVRKPELGTRPKVFYKGADESVLRPDAAARPQEGMWGRGRVLPIGDVRADAAPGGRAAAAIVAYDVPRDGSPWGWMISAYLLTKGIGAGTLMVSGLLALLAGALPGSHGGVAGFAAALPALLALVFLLVTTGFLVGDLKRPERFLLILLRPQWGSWLVRGTFCILAAVLVALVWAALALFEPGAPSAGEARLLGAFAIASGIAASGYTAFLLGQARGRAFWQSPLLLPHLVVQAFAAGAATLIIIAPVLAEAGLEKLLAAFLMGALVLDALAVGSDLFSHVGPEDARAAARAITKGRFRDLFLVAAGSRLAAFVMLVAHFWIGGAVLPLTTLASAFALVGLAVWEHVYVLAGQEPPLS